VVPAVIFQSLHRFRFRLYPLLLVVGALAVQILWVPMAAPLALIPQVLPGAAAARIRLQPQRVGMAGLAEAELVGVAAELALLGALPLLGKATTAVLGVFNAAKLSTFTRAAAEVAKGPQARTTLRLHQGVREALVPHGLTE
jgi:hypothetical protein